jgi:hypothetical protein
VVEAQITTVTQLAVLLAVAVLVVLAQQEEQEILPLPHLVREIREEQEFQAQMDGQLAVEAELVQQVAQVLLEPIKLEMVEQERCLPYLVHR